MITEDLRELVEAVTDEARRCDSGDHTVAAALLTAGGEVVRGLNTHHYLGGPCAEMVALSNHAARFPEDPVRAVVAIHGPTGQVIAPCGMCRQILFELDPGIECVVPTVRGLEAHRVGELLPLPYDRLALSRPTPPAGSGTRAGVASSAGSAGSAFGTAPSGAASPGPASPGTMPPGPAASGSVSSGSASSGTSGSGTVPSGAARSTAASLVRAGDRAFTVEQARSEHVPEIVELLHDDVLGRERERADVGTYLAAFEEIDGDPHHFLAVVLDEEGRLAGTMQLTILPGLSRGGARRLQIEAVRIAAGERGSGLGTAMLAWAEDYGRSRGAVLAQLTSDGSRADAHRFYERLGYAASHSGFKKPLG
ncbi:GNAT family N-acetyltransferase [Rothia sp. AR01]|uniref:GNAT family N-acetyltransferase n=1 Tax=Rothia santali TaxID=2949643 RepID=A0A9X2HE67_9MICC|nr:GNAT family N-acetyltransferase [Rothia santali]MCP3426057.1 GNAT family N-acetyltransferase [Rothia santali]